MNIHFDQNGFKVVDSKQPLIIKHDGATFEHADIDILVLDLYKQYFHIFLQEKLSVIVDDACVITIGLGNNTYSIAFTRKNEIFRKSFNLKTKIYGVEKLCGDYRFTLVMFYVKAHTTSAIVDNHKKRVFVFDGLTYGLYADQTEMILKRFIFHEYEYEYEKFLIPLQAKCDRMDIGICSLTSMILGVLTLQMAIKDDDLTSASIYREWNSFINSNTETQLYNKIISFIFHVLNDNIYPTGDEDQEVMNALQDVYGVLHFNYD